MTLTEHERDYEAQMAAAAASLSDEWGVRDYRAHRTRDGVAFVFTLTRSGRPVAWVEDSGRGGGPFVQFQDRRSPEALLWEAEADRLFPGDPLGAEAIVEAVLVKASL